MHDNPPFVRSMVVATVSGTTYFLGHLVGFLTMENVSSAVSAIAMIGGGIALGYGKFKEMIRKERFEDIRAASESTNAMLDENKTLLAEVRDLSKELLRLNRANLILSGKGCTMKECPMSQEIYSGAASSTCPTTPAGNLVIPDQLTRENPSS